MTEQQQVRILVDRLAVVLGVQTETAPNDVLKTLGVFQDALYALFPNEAGNRVTYESDGLVPHHIRTPRLIWKP